MSAESNSVTGPDGIPVHIAVGQTEKAAPPSADEPSSRLLAGGVQALAQRIAPWSVTVTAGEPQEFYRVERYAEEGQATEAADQFAAAAERGGVAGVRTLPRPGG